MASNRSQFGLVNPGAVEQSVGDMDQDDLTDHQRTTTAFTSNVDDVNHTTFHRGCRLTDPERLDLMGAQLCELRVLELVGVGRD